MKKSLALGVEGGFINGFKDGFNQAIAQNDFSLFEKSLKTSVGKSVLDGLMETFVNQAILAKIIGPAIDSYLQTGDSAALQAAIRAASGEAQKFYDDVLKPIAQEFDLLGSGVKTETPSTSTPDAPKDTVRTVKVEMPKVEASLSFDVLGTLATATERAMPVQQRFSDVLERAVPALEMLSKLGVQVDTAGQTLLNSAGLSMANTTRLERILAATELKPDTRAARGL